MSLEPGTDIAMTIEALRKAVEDVLACPACREPIALENAGTYVYCTSCPRTYPISNGILVFLEGETLGQEGERQFRDALASEYMKSDRQTYLDAIARSHCSIMRMYAQRFRTKFNPCQWIMDIGIGWGWHWAGQGSGGIILGVDMSVGNLRVARHLLGETEDVVLVCADATALPIREHSISGVWSVQTFQHFPYEVLYSVRDELDRTLRKEFVIEHHDLNPAWLHKVVYWVFGKQLHCRGKIGDVELNRLSAREWTDFWREFRGGQPQINCGYTELFFHSDFRIRPWLYPVRLEHVLATYAPKLAAMLARQVQVRIEARRAA